MLLDNNSAQPPTCNPSSSNFDPSIQQLFYTDRPVKHRVCALLRRRVRPGSNRLASYSTDPRPPRLATGSLRAGALKQLHSQDFCWKAASPVPSGTRGLEPRPKPAAACLHSMQPQTHRGAPRRSATRSFHTPFAGPNGVPRPSRHSLVVAAADGGDGGKRICVLGAGVIGLSSAVRLAEELENVQVCVSRVMLSCCTSMTGALSQGSPPQLRRIGCAPCQRGAAVRFCVRQPHASYSLLRASSPSCGQPRTHRRGSVAGANQPRFSSALQAIHAVPHGTSVPPPDACGPPLPPYDHPAAGVTARALAAAAQHTRACSCRCRCYR